MKIRHKSHLKWAALLLSILALTMFLVACGASGTPAEVTPTPTPTPTPSPTPAGTTYTGDGYTLRYPQGWTVNTQGGLVTISNGINAIVITVTAGGPGTDLNAALAGGLNGLKTEFQNYQQDNTVPPTASIGGDTWKQAGATGDNSGYHLKAVVLVDQHPANVGKVFIVSLAAPADSYNQVYNTAFKPILDTFKFA